MHRRSKSILPPEPKPRPVMFLVALSSSGAGKSACVDNGYVAQDFRRQYAHRKIVRVPGPEMSRLMGFGRRNANVN